MNLHYLYKSLVISPFCHCIRSYNHDGSPPDTTPPLPFCGTAIFDHSVYRVGLGFLQLQLKKSRCAIRNVTSCQHPPSQTRGAFNLLKFIAVSASASNYNHQSPQELPHQSTSERPQYVGRVCDKSTRSCAFQRQYVRLQSPR